MSPQPLQNARSECVVRVRQAGISLIELLIGMTVSVLISSMILVVWFALQSSASYSMNSNIQRDSATNVLSRMEREIRDAQARPGNQDPAIFRARPYTIVFFTTFNEGGNSVPTLVPHQVMYRLYTNGGKGELWRFEDNGSGAGTANDGVIAGVTYDYGTDLPISFPLIERQSGEGAQLVLGDVVNVVVSPATPLFQYMSYDSSGVLQSSPTASGEAARASTTAVTIRVLEDLNPSHSPVYADLQTTAQIRNQR